MNGCQFIPLLPLRKNDSLQRSNTFAAGRWSLLELRFHARLRAVRGMSILLRTERCKGAFLRNLSHPDLCRWRGGI